MSSIEFSGKSGERYRFQVLPIGTAFKAVAAVYVGTTRSLQAAKPEPPNVQTRAVISPL
jgi:hypothetical protein